MIDLRQGFFTQDRVMISVAGESGPKEKESVVCVLSQQNCVS